MNIYAGIRQDERNRPNEHLSNCILKHFPGGFLGHAMDIGASDGLTCNSTAKLEKIHNWTVLCVEANPAYAPYLHRNRAFVELCACGSNPQTSAAFHVHLDNPEAFSALEVTKHKLVKPRPDSKWETIRAPVRTVDQLMVKWQFPRLDALCVDTEGTEVDVLKGCDLDNWKPKVLVVESWDAEGPTHEYVKAKGYRLVDKSVQNYVYVRRHR